MSGPASPASPFTTAATTEATTTALSGCRNIRASEVVGLAGPIGVRKMGGGIGAGKSSLVPPCSLPPDVDRSESAPGVSGGMDQIQESATQIVAGPARRPRIET